MPTPTGLYINAALTNLALAVRGRNRYAADQVAPPLSVAKQTGVIWKVDPQNRRFRALDTVRAAGGQANLYENDNPTTVSYNAVDHALQGFVTDEEREQVDPVLKSEVDKLTDIIDSLLLDREVKFKAAIVAGVTGANTSSPATKWDNSSGDIVGSIIAAKQLIRDDAGVEPNALMITQEQLDKAFEVASVKERMISVMLPKDQGMGKAATLAYLCGLPPENVIVPFVYTNTAAVGQAAVMADLWDEQTLLFYKEPPNVRSLNFAQHLTYTGTPGSNGGFLIEMERIASRKSDAIYAHLYYDQKILNAEAAHYFTNTLT